MYIWCMRTNIELNKDLVTSALELSGIKTKKDVVNAALEEFVKMLRKKEMRALRGQIVWDGDLDEMRTYAK